MESRYESISKIAMKVLAVIMLTGGIVFAAQGQARASVVTLTGTPLEGYGSITLSIDFEQTLYYGETYDLLNLTINSISGSAVYGNSGVTFVTDESPIKSSLQGKLQLEQSSTGVLSTWVSGVLITFSTTDPVDNSEVGANETQEMILSFFDDNNFSQIYQLDEQCRIDGAAVQAIPLPSSGILLLTAMGAAIGIRRHKSHK